jgi:hypothetical protein
VVSEPRPALKTQVVAADDDGFPFDRVTKLQESGKKIVHVRVYYAFTMIAHFLQISKGATCPTERRNIDTSLWWHHKCFFFK